VNQAVVEVSESRSLMQEINSILHIPPVTPACLLGGPENFYLLG